MQVFVTGGTGYVGSVLVEHLVRAGHEVSALARSDRAERALAEAGATPVVGSLTDVTVLEDAAARADAVVHAAVDYTMTDEAAATELAAVAALVAGAGAGAEGTGKPVVYTSTGLVYGFGRDRDAREDAPLPTYSAQPVKAAAERHVLAGAGITGVVVRAGLVYGRGGSGLLTGLVDAATTSGVATYVEAGDNAWTPVHVDDLAELYLRVLAGPVGGAYNAAGEQSFTFRELAEAIGELTGTPAVSIPLTAAEQRLGPLARVLASDGRLGAEKARATFGWGPSAISLLDDVRAGSYAAAGSTSRVQPSGAGRNPTRVR